jgi:hypothetical protein
VIVDPILIPIVAIACAPVIALGIPIARALARRIDAQAQQARVPNDVSARLERMEQAIDAIAMEIERVSEAQRFTARLLAEQGPRAGGAGALPSAASPAGAGAQETIDAR